MLLQVAAAVILWCLPKSFFLPSKNLWPFWMSLILCSMHTWQQELVWLLAGCLAVWQSEFSSRASFHHACEPHQSPAQPCSPWPEIVLPPLGRPAKAQP